MMIEKKRQLLLLCNEYYQRSKNKEYFTMLEKLGAEIADRCTEILTDELFENIGENPYQE